MVSGGPASQSTGEHGTVTSIESTSESMQSAANNSSETDGRAHEWTEMGATSPDGEDARASSNLVQSRITDTLEEVSLDDEPQSEVESSSWVYNPMRLLFGSRVSVDVGAGAAAVEPASSKATTVASPRRSTSSPASTAGSSTASPERQSRSSRVSRIPGWITRKLMLSRDDGGEVADEGDEAVPESAAEWAEWTSNISEMLSSGVLDERIEGCQILQASMKGRHADMYRDKLAEYPDLIATLLTLGHRGESAVPAVFTLQVMAATVTDGPLKALFDECGATDQLIASLFRTAEEFGLITVEYHRLLAHIIATLLNLCIGSVPRKERSLRTEHFVHRLNELLYVEGPGAAKVQVVCANLIASLAIGCTERKEMLCSAGIIPHLAQLVKPENPLSLRVQAVVTLRAVMHNKHDRQLQVALQPDMMENLEALAAITPPAGSQEEQSFKEVEVALALLRHAREEAGVDAVGTEDEEVQETEGPDSEREGVDEFVNTASDDDSLFRIITL